MKAAFWLLLPTLVGFTVERDPTVLAPVRYGALTMAFVLQVDGSDDVADGSDLQALRDALASWGLPSCSNFSFVDGGTQSARTYAQDGTNLITFLESGTWPFEPGGAAFTVRYLSTTGTPQEIIETDIILNGIDFEWSTDGNLDRIDIQSVVAHELGHAVGIWHSAQPTATMYPLTSIGNPVGRTLTNDDIAALCFLYPAGGFACSDDSHCPQYNNNFGGTKTRTFCSASACVVGAAIFGADCYDDADCLSGLCAQNPDIAPTGGVNPGFCSQACSGPGVCPLTSYCSSDTDEATTRGTALCYLQREDCALSIRAVPDSDDCTTHVDDRCIRDLDGKIRCRRLCHMDSDCTFLPDSICRGGEPLPGLPGFCYVPGATLGNVACDSGLECQSLSCSLAGPTPECVPLQVGGSDAANADGGVGDVPPADVFGGDSPGALPANLAARAQIGCACEAVEPTPLLLWFLLLVGQFISRAQRSP